MAYTVKTLLGLLERVQIQKLPAKLAQIKSINGPGK